MSKIYCEDCQDTGVVAVSSPSNTLGLQYLEVSCVDCCPHDEHDHGICVDCGKDCHGDLVSQAEIYFEGER